MSRARDVGVAAGTPVGLAVGSLAVLFVGALSPWASRFGDRVDGSDDEVVLILALVAAIAIVVFVVTRNRGLASVPLVAGVASAMLVATTLHDPAGPFGGPGDDIELHWGIWTTLAGSVGLAVASSALIARRPAAALRARATARSAARAAAPSEAELRMSFATAASRFTPYVAVEQEEALYFLGTESRYGRRLFAERDRWTDGRRLDRARRALASAGLELGRRTFVDIGANVGTSTIQALRRHGFVSALAFEPEPESFRILRANLAANGLDGLVRVFNLALSDWTGTGRLLVHGRGSATHRLLGDREAGEGTLAVPVTTYDRLAEEGAVDPDEAGLLWIDVQGSELGVLAGARTLLERSVPIVIEFSPHRFAEAERLESFLGVLSPSYTHFFDLKPRLSEARRFEPLSAIRELLTRRTKNTDLLVVRLP